MSYAIRVDNLGKHYRLGQTHAGSIRELVNRGVNRLLPANTTLVGRLLRWPLALLPHKAIVPVLSGPLCGLKWIIGSGPHGYWLGTYERDKQQLLRRYLKKGDCFLDVGANVGYYTLLASRLVGPAGRVVAFEPLPRNLAYLRRHVRLNGLSNVSVFEAAVADADGMVNFAASDNPSMGSMASGGSLQVPAVSLDALWRTRQISEPRVIKIDVEGAESAVLRGATELLSQARPTVLLAGHGWKQQKECEQILTGLGYRVEMQRDGRADGMYESVAVPLTNDP